MTKAIGFAAIRHVRIGTSSTAVVLGTDTSGVEAEAFFRLDDVSACRWGALVLCSSWRRAVAGSLIGRDRERCGPYRAPRRCWFIARHCSARARPPDSAMATVAIS
jgi:hypothetical protein